MGATGFRSCVRMNPSFRLLVVDVYLGRKGPRFAAERSHHATYLMYEVYWDGECRKATLEGDLGERRREQETVGEL